MIQKINPDILKWARKTAGFSQEEAAHKLSLADINKLSAIDRLYALEQGEIEPTRALLNKMAKLYRRPLLVFYLNQPPKTGDRGQDFRTLPKDIDNHDNAIVDALIRDIKSRQELVRAVLEDEEDIEPLEFIGSIKLEDGIRKAVGSATNALKFDLKGYRKQASSLQAFEYLRNSAEKAGVFVLLAGNLGSHHTNIDTELFRGFALADDLAPFIVINHNDSKVAWSFTLLHELVHLLLGQTGISNINSNKAIERFCNEVAGEILLPLGELSELKISRSMSFSELKDEINKFADARNISSTMVAYNLYKNERISRDRWEHLRDVFTEDFNNSRTRLRERAREKEGGPDYYLLRRHRIGEALLSTVSRALRDGNITTLKAARVLGVRPKNVGRLLKKQ
jgi:Zn-dependent peptidase ImmA (M78 family)/DNA-binding XRE family transcriptional regulator